MGLSGSLIARGGGAEGAGDAGALNRADAVEADRPPAVLHFGKERGAGP